MKRGGGIGRRGMAAYRLGIRPDRKSCEVQILARAIIFNKILVRMSG